MCSDTENKVSILSKVNLSSSSWASHCIPPLADQRLPSLLMRRNTEVLRLRKCSAKRKGGLIHYRYVLYMTPLQKNTNYSFNRLNFQGQHYNCFCLLKLIAAFHFTRRIKSLHLLDLMSSQYKMKHSISG